MASGPLPESSSKSDFKDFVEHLRSVHFSLIAVCIGLILILTSPPPSQIKIAHQQLQDIMELQRGWNGTWLDEAAQKKAEQISAKRKNRPSNRVTKGFPKAVEIENRTLLLRYGRNGWFVDIPERPSPLFAPNATAPQIVETQEQIQAQPPTFPPRTLIDFRTSWDFFEHPKVYVALGLTGTYRILPVDSKDQPRSDVYTEVPSAKQFDDAVSMTFNQDPEVLKDGSARHVYVGRIEGGGDSEETFLFGVEEEPTELDVQSILINVVPSANWHHGKFATVFRELDDLTLGYQELKLSSIEKIILRQAERKPESFEAFGLKFPVETTAIWGIPILVGLQIYFLLHVGELRKLRVTESRAGIAWIALYDNPFAQIVFFISAFALPLGVTFLLVTSAFWEGHHSFWHGALVGIIVVIDASMVVWTVFIFYQKPRSDLSSGQETSEIDDKK